MRNYYSLELKELDYWIDQMKTWLFVNQGHPKKGEVNEALNVAQSAKKYKLLLQEKPELADYGLLFTREVIQ